MRLLRCQVVHSRLKPRSYKFKNTFLWFHFSLKEDFSTYPLLSKNSFNLYAFYEKDYLPLGGANLMENVAIYLKKQGITKKVVDVEMFTNLSFLGYLFNPVCFFVVKLEQDESCAIIHIGNTFGEVKPFLVPPSEMKKDGFKVHFTKYFYISPFIKHDNSMDFSLKIKSDEVQALIEDKDKDGALELVASMKGEFLPFTLKNLLLESIRSPFNTFKVIFFIHYHALKLYLMKIPYFKKSEHTELQQGALSWKKS